MRIKNVSLYIIKLCLFTSISSYAFSMDKTTATTISQQLFNAGDQHYKRTEYALAIPFFQQAAELGNPEAMNRLGIMYRFGGHDVEINYEQAVHWFEQAAQFNYPDAINNLGIMYEYGYGVDVDYPYAAALYRQAIELHHRDALFNLARLYHDGFGVTQDQQRAEELYRQADPRGHGLAGIVLSLMSH